MGCEDPELPHTTSREPDWPAEAQECYEDALRALLKADISFVVGGAFAVHTHTGIWRTTKDLDLLLTAQDLPEALGRLKSRGFETYVKDPVWLAKARRGEYFVDLITGIGNASQAVSKMWIDRGVPEVIFGIPCRVLGVEELIASKVFVAFRERFDGADVAHLIRARGKSMNWERLFELLGGHWQLLYWSLVLFAYVYPAHANDVPDHIWEGMATRFSHKIKSRRQDAAFRGTLIDPRMFAIDVEEWGERNLYKEYCESHPWPMQADNLRGRDE
jgi:hypothetical protein